MNYKLMIIAGLGLVLFISCKKNEDSDNEPPAPPVPPTLPAYVIKTATHTGSVTYKNVYTYNANAQVTSRQYFSPTTASDWAISKTYTYDSEGKLIATASISKGSANVSREEFIYDSEDRLITRKTFLNTDPTGTSTYSYKGNMVIEDYAGQVEYTSTLDNKGNIIKKDVEFALTPIENYTGEWLDYDDKPIVHEAPPSAGHLDSKNNFHKSRITFKDLQRQSFNKTYDYEYKFNPDGYVTESKQFDAGNLIWTITYELIKP